MVEIILVPGTPRSILTISLSSGDSLDRNNLVKVSVSSSSDCAAMPKGTFSSRTFQPTTLFLGLVTKTWQDGLSGDEMVRNARSTCTDLKLDQISSTALVDLK
eukprot:TRINITY_DN13003_c0_g1_i2.p2 TRINITY_DN13003_c0_g1~~TRINITY_DN13003_c0_g1_i2.p2  ORF type:complete len:103 (-),score=7.37 TRINITY_DN13003_c0_g1_i2:175-483(-)